MKIKNKIWEGEKKERERKEKGKKTHTEERGEERTLNLLLLSVGDKREILKQFNTIICLMKHNNLLVLGKFGSGKDVFRGNF